MLKIISRYNCFFRSRTGFVNVYGSDATECSSDYASNTVPRPLKALDNLTTAISCLRFNHDSQLLAVASHTKKDQMRLVCTVQP